MSLALHFILVTVLFQFHLAFASDSNPLGLSIRAAIDDSPESPLYQIEKLTLAERVERLINITNARVNYLDSILDDQNDENSKLINPNNIGLKIYREGLFYVVTFTIGSRQQQVKLLMDTGGSLVWTQCQPCITCFNQTLPIYDPRLSGTYGRLPCSHNFCQGPDSLYLCVNASYCFYNLHYGGGASSSGIASYELFEFPMADGSTRRFRNVIFGCSDHTVRFACQNTAISGIFGLNKSPDSMSSQFSTIIQSRFSYCLVPFPDAMPRPLVLRFGEDIPLRPRVQTTLFMEVPSRRYMYYLQLLDITVANHRIGFHQGAFSIRGEGEGGLLLDSGALFSFIDANTIGINAYQAVIQVYQAYYGSKGLHRTRGTMGFELCYEIPPSYSDYASITFHLNGADYTVIGQYGHIVLPGFFCVAISSSPKKSILGAWHQQNKRLIYDRNRGALQFSEELCRNDVL